MDTEVCPSDHRRKAKWQMVATQESMNIVNPLKKDGPKARYKCPKCGWTGKESELSVEETSGDAWCPTCGSECNRIHKKARGNEP